MGCSASMTGMGRAGPALPEPEAPPPVDPRLPLDARQKFHLEKSWKSVARNIDRAGMFMFLRLFRDCPEMIEKYPELRGMDDQEELRNSQFLQEHSQRVLDAFDHTIDSLDDVDYVIQLLKKIGQMHADLELKPDDMWKLEQPFLAAVAECLEDRYTPKFQEIYSKLITFIIEHVVNGFDPH
eukprot:XP_002610016.1 hypothetical protein BRAFLDRAFT_99970 [Branchiostoma floridae]